MGGLKDELKTAVQSHVPDTAVDRASLLPRVQQQVLDPLD
jgi:hypothetical protein